MIVGLDTLRACSWTRMVPRAPGATADRASGAPSHVRVEYGALAHSLLVVMAGLVLIAMEAPTWRFWLWPELWFTGQAAVTTPGQALLFSMGAAYFLLDSVFLAVQAPGGLSPRMVAGYVVHHACCSLGLLGPVAWGRDAPMVLLGYVLGELSNPARVVAQLAETRGHTRLAAALDLSHMAGFLALRALSCKLAFDVFWGPAELALTRMAMAGLALISGMAVAHQLLEPPQRARKFD